MTNEPRKPTPAAGGIRMNPFIKRATIILMATIVFALHFTVFAVAAIPPEANFLGRITGVVAPVRLAIDSSGRVYVADPRNGGVLQFDGTGALV